MTNLVLNYNFKNYVAGSNTIVNKGTLGSAYNVTIGGNLSVINTDHATGTSCLSLIGEGTSSGGYLQIPNFKWTPTFLYNGPLFTISFWYKKPASSITETNARIIDLYYDSNNYFYIYFNSSGNLVLKKNDVYGLIDTVLVNTNVCDGRWHHFAITNNNTLTNKIYIDGVFTTNFTNANSGFGIGINYSSCYIGRSSTSTDYYATECIDDFRIYNYYMQPADVSALFALYNKPSCNYLFVGNPPVGLNLFM